MLINKPVHLEHSPHNDQFQIVDRYGNIVCYLVESPDNTYIQSVAEEITNALNTTFSKNKPKWYIDQREPELPYSKFLIIHSGCYVYGDKDREWGTISGSYCSGCAEEIPREIIFQRDLMNGK